MEKAVKDPTQGAERLLWDLSGVMWDMCVSDTILNPTELTEVPKF